MRFFQQRIFSFVFAVALSSVTQAKERTRVLDKAPTVCVISVGGSNCGNASSGTYTTPTSPSPLYLHIRMSGGGGGGAAAGSIASISQDGNPSTLSDNTGVILSANGGNRGQETNGVPGPGGAYTVNAPAIDMGSVTGGSGTGLNFVSSTNTVQTGGNGGNNPFGGSGGTIAGAAALSGVVQTGGGGGGGAGTSASVVPGSGGGAGGYVNAMIVSPAASYTYSVGTGGSAGTSSANGYDGGAGGSGVIIIEEYYQ